MRDLRPTPAQIAADVVAGLSAQPKELPSKYFYDARGSALFERITRQPEYYLTRLESALLEASMPAVAAATGLGAHVVEYGSGSGRKTATLLAGLERPVAYTPVEISPVALSGSVERLSGTFPQVEMLPLCADFTRPLSLPVPATGPASRLLFFPGSTLGNFDTATATDLLAGMRETMGADGLALIGIDLVKDVESLEAAYNDAAGVTAEFTLNLLARLNRAVGSDFDLASFRHRAVWAADRRRIETFLVSTREQQVAIAGRRFVFEPGEAMLVEVSHKYDDAGFAALVAAAGLQVTRRWNDPADRFGLRLLRPGTPR